MAKTRTRGVLLSALVLSLTLGATSAGAQQARAVGVTPPRVSFIDGEVSYWRPGAEDWVPAQINTALAAGDALYAADGGNVEIELAARSYVRVGSGTEVTLESLETGYLQLRLPAGHMVVDLARLPEGQLIEVDTPNGAFLIGQAGYFRFDVDEDSTRFTVRGGGLARVVAAGGTDEIEVASTETVIVSGVETATVQRVAPVSEDAWDRWNRDRTTGLDEEPRSARYVSPQVAGVYDLDRYGDWRDTRDYGAVWVPRGVAADWAPYSTGRWVWDPSYGWTWVDDAPWGWAPYHYGRWCRIDDYWGWAPGPVVARPVYSPALVAFFGGGGVGVSVSVGTPFVSWVALGWGEPVLPWWGPRGFVGRPYWGGWGGPRYVNNVRIDNRTIINVNNINRYDNFRHRNAVIGIDRDRFGRGGRGRFEHVRLEGDRLRNLRPVRGELSVRPGRESLVPRIGRGNPPPDRIRNRRVVATRSPQDLSRLPRSAGLVRSEERRRPEPRIVSPRGERASVRREGGRSAPPPRGGGDRLRGTGGDVRARGRAGEPGEVRRRGEVRAPAAGEVDRAPGRRDGGDVRRPQRGAPAAERSRDVGRSTERRGVDRGPTPPAERGRQDARGRGAERPPRAPQGQDRERGEIRTPRESGRGDATTRGRQRIEQPRQERAPRQQREIQRQSAPRAPRQEAPRAPRQEAPRMQRQEAPRPQREMRRQRQEAPRVQRQTAPRVERQAAPRVQREMRMPRQEAPRAQRQSAPRMERQSAPRMERQSAPRVERGGGGRGDGGRRGRD